jgi:hypothetical protein
MKNSIITLYHGSERIIEKPVFGEGKRNNDYGLGFYCTENIGIAKEWAVAPQRDGYANRYVLDAEYLKVLNLGDENYTILNWIAVLLDHRLFSLSNPNVTRAKRYLIENFGINVNAFDLIRGYRADDSYFDFAQAFINNAITVNQLAKAMYLGNLGEQVVLKSQFAFSCLSFVGYEDAKWLEYYDSREKRNSEANQAYLSILQEDPKGLFIQDIIREGIKNDDARIPRNICQ